MITYAIGPRKMVLGQPKEQREKLINEIPDPARRAQRRSVIEHGVEAPEFAGAFGAFVAFADEMEGALASQPWLSGDAFGLPDANALPYILRMDQLAMNPVIDARPKVADWFTRVQARKSYGTAVTEWLPAPILALFKANGEEVWPQVERLLR